jgi:hypothetical protein
LIKKLFLKKEFIILISFIILILSVSSVSANENLVISEDIQENDDLNSINNEKLAISEDIQENDDLNDEPSMSLENGNLAHSTTLEEMGDNNPSTNSNDDYVLESNNITMYYKNGSKFSTTLKDNNGAPVVNKTIHFNINSVIYNRTTDSNGTAFITINLNPGEYNIVSTYNSGSKNFTCNGKVDVLSTISGKDLTKYFRNGSQFSVSVLDNIGNPLKNKSVRMNINGVFYDRKTNDDGIATLSINLIPNKYTITVFHPDTGLQMSYNVTVLSTLSGKDLTKYFRNDSQYSVTVLDNAGNPLKNKSVRMNINGVFYDRKTNDDGIATLSINLYPNKYTITVYHPDTGLEHSNLITVLSTMMTQDLKSEYTYPAIFQVTALDKQGKANPNANVTISIGKSSLTKPTDGNGSVIFNITANSGIYTITTSYDDHSVSNLLEIYRPTPDGFERFNLGANSNGKAGLIKSIGNKSSDYRIAYIIGVHPTEHAVHQSLYDLLLANSSKLSYCYDIYKIDVNSDKYSDGRMKGQLLGQEYVVPEIIKTNYNLVVDVHSNQGTVGGNYLHTNFAFAPYQDNISKKYSDKVINDNPALVQYFPESQTSPAYITIPIAKSGIPTILYETYKFEAKSITDNYVNKLITSVETIDFNN